MVVQGVEEVDIYIVKSYTRDLKSLLEESDIIERKAFLRSFIKRIEINKDEARIYYHLPLPQDKKSKVAAEVLSIVTPGGAEGIRTPDLLRAREALSQLSYSPVRDIIAMRLSSWQSSVNHSGSQLPFYFNNGINGGQPTL